MKRIILYAAILETIYLTLSFILAQIYGQWSYESEILRTVLRVISIVFYSYYYQKYFFNEYQSFNTKEIITPHFIAALSLLFIFAIVYTNAENETVMWQVVFSFSGITAGLREELLYRGIIQNVLQRKYNHKIALFIATIIFVLSHTQYFYYGQLQGLLFIAFAGVIFGSIFIMTGSVALTAFIHGLYDAMLSVNIISFRISNGIALPILFLVMMAFLMINKKLFRSQESNNAEASPI
jgi:membrane protease YdiL (CAAX protease family)